MDEKLNDVLKCFYIPETFAIVMAGVTFFIAYLLFIAILFTLKRMAKRALFWERLTKKIRLPLMWLLLEIAFLIVIHLFTLPEKPLRIAEHGLHVLIIGTLGWLIIRIFNACYHSYAERAANRELADQASRSLFTQVLFLYRFSVFLVSIIVVAAILLTFPYVKSIGIGILSSAGIAGLALGIAARPILLNLIAGFQIAATKTVKIGDTLFIDNESLRVESIHLTHVILRTWDLRRTIMPISYFIDHSFQNWDVEGSEIQGTVFIYCDYSLPLEAVRNKMKELVGQTPYWNKKTWNVYVTNCKDQNMEIRLSASADNTSLAFELRAFLREKMIEFIQKEFPNSLPCLRSVSLSTK